MSSSGQTTLTTTNSVTINFSPPSNLLVNYFTITARPVNGGTSVIQKFGVSTNSYTILGLNSNTTYSFTMTASSAYGQSNPSNPLITSTLPLPPSPLTTIVTYNSVYVILTQPYGSIYSYVVSLVPTLGGSTTTIIVPGIGNTCTFTGLSGNTYYNISAIANSPTGLSSTATTIQALTIPSAPTSFSTSTPTVSTILINFTAYTANVTSFTVTAVPTVGGSTVSQSFNFPASSYTITGLISATPYNISLVAINGTGTSPSSSTVLYSTIPNAPTGLSLTSITNTSAIIGFTSPSGTLTGYTVSAVDASGVAITPQTFSAPASSYTITNLTPAKNYTVSLVANVANGSSASTTLSLVYTAPNAPTGLTFTSSTTTSITFSFTAPSGNISNYTVSAVDASGNAITPQTFNAPASSYTITGLAAGNLYTISLVATNVNATSTASTSVNFTTKNVAPTGLTLGSTTTSTAYFTFTPPSGLITSYTATAVPTSGTTVTQTFNAPATSYTITGLVSGTSYTITLTDTNDGGTSTASSSITAVTIPLAPTGLTGTSATNNSITFSFTPPTGTTLSTYTVTAVDTSSNVFTQNFNAPASSYTITGLLPYTLYSVSYSITLTATNSGGTSVSSSTLTYSKLATVTPSVPTGLAYSTYTDTIITVNWTASTNSSITTYNIKTVDASNNTIIQTTSAPATTYTITGLNSASSYTISISATNIAGTSSYSSTISVTTLNSYIVSSSMYSCYSARLFLSSYTGPVFNIRRSSDNVTQNFYTNSSQSYMTTGSGGTGTSYASWLGANTGYITIWYDQTGNGNHAINSTNNTTQPILIANQTSNLITINYVVMWTRTNSTILTLTSAVTPYAIFSIFYNNNSSYGTILSGTGSNVLHFGGYGYVINGSNSSTDWYYSSTGTKLAYANGTDISPNYKLPANTSTWNYMSLSVQNPAFSFNYIGRDPTNSTANSINGYMLDMILYNKEINSTSMKLYYSNALSLIPLITSPYYFASLTYQPNTWRFTENKQKLFYSAYASGSWKLFVLTWNGYGYDNETIALSYIPANVFVVNSDGTRIAILGATNQFQIYVSTFNGTTYSSPTASPQITNGSPYITFGYGTSVSMTPDGNRIIIGTDDQVTYIYYSSWDSTNSCYKSPVLISTTYTDFPCVDVTTDGSRIVATAYGVNYPITATWNGSTNYGGFSQFTTLSQLQNGATRSLHISDNLSIAANTGSIVYANKNSGSYVVTTLNFNFDQYYSPLHIFKDNSYFGYLSNSNPGYNWFVYLHRVS
jgi:hypothetical protein